MHISGLRESKYLQRADVGAGALVTMKGLHQVNMAREGEPEELKWVLDFVEADKPLVLNNTNAQIIAQIVKSEETDDWAGHQIVLYDDPNVSFGGKLVGGIRVRAPRKPAPKPAPAPGPAATQPARRLAPPVTAPVDPGPGPEADEDTPF